MRLRMLRYLELLSKLKWIISVGDCFLTFTKNLLLSSCNSFLFSVKILLNSIFESTDEKLSEESCSTAKFALFFLDLLYHLQSNRRYLKIFYY